MRNYAIIGASSGIGKSTAELLASDNQVFGTYNSTSPEPASANCQFHHLNVFDEIDSLDFLPESLDGLVYCPGAIELKPFKRNKPEDFMHDFELQVIGAVKVIQAALPRLKKSDHASIVLFSSVAATTGFNFHTTVATSKGAIEGLTKALAAELSPSIRVNAIAPSITHTPLAEKFLNSETKIKSNKERHPLKRIGSSQDMAQLTVFLLSDKASWITGQIISVDGGISSIRK